MNTVERKEAKRLKFEIITKKKIINKAILSNTNKGFMQRFIRKQLVAVPDRNRLDDFSTEDSLKEFVKQSIQDFLSFNCDRAVFFG